MQTAIVCVLLFSLRTISLAANVTVYKVNDYDNAEPQKLEPDAVSRFPWKFGYSRTWDNFYHIYIFISNKSPSVTAINVTCQLYNRTLEAEKLTQKYNKEFYYIHFTIAMSMSTEIKINLNFCTSNILCSPLLIAEGRDVDEITNETLKNEFPNYDTCLKYGCVLVLDLTNKCDGPPLVTDTKMDTTTDNPENANHQSSQNIVLIYVIPSVIGTGVIILVIYLIRVKKYCHWNSHPVETMQLNTYSTANEVVYADLGFVHGDSQPPTRGEESTYAQIIGVLKPADANVKNK